MSDPDRRYIPGNGTEGMIFFDGWCSRCERDAVMGKGEDWNLCADHELCPIIAASFRGPVDEWVHDEEGDPKCTAFVPLNDRIPIRDALTIDMFEQREDA